MKCYHNSKQNVTIIQKKDRWKSRKKTSDNCGVFGLLGSRPDYRMAESAVLCAARLVVGSNPTNACGYMICRQVDQLPCWPGQQMSRQRWIWGIHCRQVRKQTSEGSTRLWNPVQTSLEVQNRGFSGPTKKNILKKEDLLTTGRYVYHPLLPLSVNKDDPAVYADFTVLERSPSAMAVHRGMLR